MQESQAATFMQRAYTHFGYLSLVFRMYLIYALHHKNYWRDTFTHPFQLSDLCSQIRNLLLQCSRADTPSTAALRLSRVLCLFSGLYKLFRQLFVLPT